MLWTWRQSWVSKRELHGKQRGLHWCCQCVSQNKKEVSDQNRACQSLKVLGDIGVAEKQWPTMKTGAIEALGLDNNRTVARKHIIYIYSFTCTDTHLSAPEHQNAKSSAVIEVVTVLDH